MTGPIETSGYRSESGFLSPPLGPLHPSPKMYCADGLAPGGTIVTYRLLRDQPERIQQTGAPMEPCAGVVTVRMMRAGWKKVTRTPPHLPEIHGSPNGKRHPRIRSLHR